MLLLKREGLPMCYIRHTELFSSSDLLRMFQIVKSTHTTVEREILLKHNLIDVLSSRFRLLALRIS